METYYSFPNMKKIAFFDILLELQKLEVVMTHQFKDKDNGLTWEFQKVVMTLFILQKQFKMWWKETDMMNPLKF